MLSLFDAVNRGNPPANITGYNGGLFAPSLLDELALNDEARTANFVLTRLLRWDDLDFESQLDVEVLGHVFENSISDLANLERELVDEPNAVRLQWRNREGIFYTPEWVTRYIVRNSVETYLDDNPEVGPDFVICDPACGSGAFLTEMVPLIREHLDRLAPAEAQNVRAAHEVRERRLDLFADPAVEEPLALYAALKRSVFGVDKSAESVEITKLSFWLKTVVKGHALPALDSNMRVGNSLVAEPIVPDAFDWALQLPRVAGVANVIVGNPPWGADVSEYEAGLTTFTLAEGQYDVAFVFVEQAMRLLREGGILGFVLPDSLLVNEDQARVRRFLVDNHTLLQVIKLGEGVFPGVFRGAVVLIVRKGPPPAGHAFRGLVITKADRRNITDVASVVDLDVLMATRGNTHSQARIAGKTGAELTINVAEEDEALVEKIAGHALDWAELIERGRGIELNSDANVIQCPNCFKWDAPPMLRKGVYRDKTCSHCGQSYPLQNALAQASLVSEGQASGDDEAVYVDGTDIRRYGILRTRRIDLSKDGIAYKQKELYASPKIIWRQTGVGTTATIDHSLDAYVPQSVYIFRLKTGLTGAHANYKLEYFLGILNSRVLLYHFLCTTGQVEWQSFPRWTMGRVFQIPIRAIDWSKPTEVALHAKIVDNVRKLIQSGGSPNSESDLEIERCVMDLYGVTALERQRVWGVLKAVQGVKTVSDLVPGT
jgi:hypothetical protein